MCFFSFLPCACFVDRQGTLLQGAASNKWPGQAFLHAHEELQKRILRNMGLDAMEIQGVKYWVLEARHNTRSGGFTRNNENKFIQIPTHRQACGVWHGSMRWNLIASFNASCGLPWGQKKSENAPVFTSTFLRLLFRGLATESDSMYWTYGDAWWIMVVFLLDNNIGLRMSVWMIVPSRSF